MLVRCNLSGDIAMYLIIEHREELGNPHVIPDTPRRGPLGQFWTGLRELNSDSSNDIHIGISAGGTRHIAVCVNPEASEAEQIIERFSWGLDVPWEQVERQLQGRLDAKYGEGRQIHHSVKREL